MIAIPSRQNWFLQFLMPPSFIDVGLLILGTATAAATAGYLPMHHFPEFVRFAKTLGFISIYVWEYEFWGNLFGALIAVSISCLFPLPTALRFGFMYAVTFPIIIFTRAPHIHSLPLTLAGSLLTILSTLLLAIAIGAGLRKLLPSRTRWSSWSQPSKISVVTALIGFPIAIFGWFAISPYDIFPLDPQKPVVLKFIRNGQNIEFHGSDGTTIEKAIKIAAPQSENATTGTIYITGEYHWIDTYYPKYRAVAHGLLPIPRWGFRGTIIVNEDKIIAPTTKPTEYVFFDVIITIDWLGRQKEFYFDSSYYAPERLKPVDDIYSRITFFTRCTLRPGVTKEIAESMKEKCPNTRRK